MSGVHNTIDSPVCKFKMVVQEEQCTNHIIFCCKYLSDMSSYLFPYISSLFSSLCLMSVLVGGIYTLLVLPDSVKKKKINNSLTSWSK